MQRLISYLQLMRFDKPIGIFLLLWPTYWGLWVASEGMPSLKLLVLFTLGVIIMRAAGCIINDIADRHLDSYVKRTQQRPLAKGSISLQEALALLILLLSLALVIVSFLNPLCFYLAMIGALLTLIYPFCKRFIDAPQLILGFAFSWGIPMAFAAVLSHVPIVAIALMFITFLWILMYDTMYAMADRDDDLAIGIRSTAILLGGKDIFVLIGLQVVIQACWLIIAIFLHLKPTFYVFWVLATILFGYQQALIKERASLNCFKAFLNNHWYGITMWLAIFVGISC